MVLRQLGQKKKFVRLYHKGKKLGRKVHTCHSTYSGKPKIDDHGPGWPRQKNKQDKKGLES
jgi:hypothetical protein